MSFYCRLTAPYWGLPPSEETTGHWQMVHRVPIGPRRTLFFPAFTGPARQPSCQPNRQRRSVARFAQTGGRAVAVDLQPGNAQTRNPVRFDRVLPGEEFFNR